MAQYSLADLRVGQSAHIADLAADQEFSSRLRSMGLLPSVPVTLTSRAVFGLSMAVRVLGSTVTLRGRDAKRVKVRF